MQSYDDMEWIRYSTVPVAHSCIENKHIFYLRRTTI